MIKSLHQEINKLEINLEVTSYWISEQPDYEADVLANSAVSESEIFYLPKNNQRFHKKTQRLI